MIYPTLPLAIISTNSRSPHQGLYVKALKDLIRKARPENTPKPFDYVAFWFPI